MNTRERVLAVLNYQAYDRLPIAHFGFWAGTGDPTTDTLAKWAQEGHLPKELAQSWSDGNPADSEVSAKMGFDLNWQCLLTPNSYLHPGFERKIIEELPGGARKVLNYDGVIVLEKPGVCSIPSEIDHTLKGRREWEAHYLHRLQFSQERIDAAHVRINGEMLPWTKGGREFLQTNERDYLYGLHCGSLFGNIRNILGMEKCVCLFAEDPGLFDEIIHTVAELCCQCTKKILESGAKFDFAHFWEDICFKNGPLVTPSVFDEKVGPHYRRITDLLRDYGIGIVSVDCDGLIDALVPTWFNNGVNTMFPIEVGTWCADIRPWRKRYGKELRGVGGMDKKVLSRDFAAVDAEVERLKPLVDLGGYLPCPDHRIAPDAKWDTVRYYCDTMRKTFG